MIPYEFFRILTIIYWIFWIFQNSYRYLLSSFLLYLTHTSPPLAVYNFIVSQSDHMHLVISSSIVSPIPTMIWVSFEFLYIWSYSRICAHIWRFEARRVVENNMQYLSCRRLSYLIQCYLYWGSFIYLQRWWFYLFFYSWAELDSVYIQHCHYLFIRHWPFRMLLFLNSSYEHEWISITKVECWGLSACVKWVV